MPVIAHIILPVSSLAILLAWGSASLGLLAGAVLLIADLQRRRLGALIFAVSSAGAAAAAVFTPWPPAPPGYALSVASPHPGAGVTTPFAVTVCARSTDGAAATVPGGDRVLYVAVDGRQVMVTRSASLLVAAAAGPHTLRLEVLTADHRAFSPPLLVDLPVDVVGQAPPSLAEARCRG